MTVLWLHASSDCNLAGVSTRTVGTHCERDMQVRYAVLDVGVVMWHPFVA